MSNATRRLLDEYPVVAARGEDRRAFADLVRRWQRKLIAHAWRLTGDDDAARDAVQAAWLEIARSRSSPGRASLSGLEATFIGALWTGWEFFRAPDVLTALHWGLPSAVLLIVSLMIKLALWPVMQTNRLLAALKRLELIVVDERAG